MFLMGMKAALAVEISLPNVFSNPEYHYSIHYPENWKAVDRGKGVVIFTEMKPGPFMINIQTISTRKGGGKYKDIKDLMDDFKIQVPMHTKDAKFLDRKPFVLHEPDGSTLSGEETILTFEEDKMLWKQWQVMLINQNGMIFQALGYRAPASMFDVMQPTAAAMLASWIISN